LFSFHSGSLCHDGSIKDVMPLQDCQIGKPCNPERVSGVSSPVIKGDEQ